MSPPPIVCLVLFEFRHLLVELRFLSAAVLLETCYRIKAAYASYSHRYKKEYRTMIALLVVDLLIERCHGHVRRALRYVDASSS